MQIMGSQEKYVFINEEHGLGMTAIGSRLDKNLKQIFKKGRIIFTKNNFFRLSQFY